MNKVYAVSNTYPGGMTRIVNLFDSHDKAEKSIKTYLYYEFNHDEELQMRFISFENYFKNEKDSWSIKEWEVL